MAVTQAELEKASRLLQEGEIVGIPTETVYGLAAAITNESGIRRIFFTKERPFFDPLIVHVASLKMAASVVSEWPPLADFIARTFWPGPLTLVLPKAKEISSLITSGLETVAVRYPSHPDVLELLKLVNVPLAAPSANKFGRTSPTTAEHVRSEFPNILVLDGGPCSVGLESTVVSFIKDQDGCEVIEILRPGGITQEAIKEALKKWSNPVIVRRANSQASPGHLEHHYMPAIPLVLLRTDQSFQDVREKIETQLKHRFMNPVQLELNEDPAQAARELYAQMRKLSQAPADLLFIKMDDQKTGREWEAIWDRLSRAATARI